MHGCDNAWHVQPFIKQRCFKKSIPLSLQNFAGNTVELQIQRVQDQIGCFQNDIGLLDPASFL